MATSSLDRLPVCRPSWTRWLGSSEGETRAFIDDLARRLVLTPEQRPLWDCFVQKLLRSVSAAHVRDPGDGWDQGRSPAQDQLLRLEIAAGCFLGAVEEARDCFARVYGTLSPAQQRLVDTAIAPMGSP